MGATVCVLVAWVYQGRAFAAFRAPSNAYFAHDPLARSAPSPRAPPTTLRPAGRPGRGCVVTATLLGRAPQSSRNSNGECTMAWRNGAVDTPAP